MKKRNFVGASLRSAQAAAMLNVEQKDERSVATEA